MAHDVLLLPRPGTAGPRYRPTSFLPDVLLESYGISGTEVGYGATRRRVPYQIASRSRACA
eukprot:2245703-Rhodomonas_salina.3